MTSCRAAMPQVITVRSIAGSSSRASSNCRQRRKNAPDGPATVSSKHRDRRQDSSRIASFIRHAYRTKIEFLLSHYDFFGQPEVWELGTTEELLRAMVDRAWSNGAVALVLEWFSLRGCCGSGFGWFLLKGSPLRGARLRARAGARRAILRAVTVALVDQHSCPHRVLPVWFATL